MHKRGLRFAVTALAALLIFITPGQAFAEDVFLAGTADEIIPGTAESADETLPDFGTENDFVDADLYEAEPAAATDTDAKQALAGVVGYLNGKSGNLTVGTEGGEWSLIALERNGALGDSARNTYMQNLASVLNSVNGKLSAAKYTEYSRVALAVSVLGLNPRNVGGYDLLQPLADFRKVKIQGINGPIWALIAFDSGNYEIPALPAGSEGEQTGRDGIIRYLLDHQYTAPDGTAGGWSFSGYGLDDICPMAIQALVPYYSSDPEVKAAVDRALDLWSKMQSADGGFGDTGNSGKGGAEAISQTIIALSALDVNLIHSEQFIKNGNTLLDALLQYQAPDGSFCHTVGDGGGNAIATDQAALALTAYDRALSGKTRLYDMSDVKQQDKEVPAQTVAALKQELAAIPNHPMMDDKAAVFAVEGKLAQAGEFAEKENLLARLAQLKQEIAKQEAVLNAWDDDMWKINPNTVTEENRAAVEDLRARYNALPAANRRYLKNAQDLMKAEETLLTAGQKGHPLWGDQKGKKPVPNGNLPQKRPSSGSGIRTSVESNTILARVEDGVVPAGEFRQAESLKRILRIEGKLPNGDPYAMTIAGEDIADAFDMKSGITTESEYAEEIGRLAQEAFVFRFEQKGDFPGPMQVEIKTNLKDGTYLLLRYNEELKKAEDPVKLRITDGTAAFMAEKGGHYLISQKVSSRSLDELDAARQEENTEITPEDVPDPEEILPGTGSAVNHWLVALCIILGVLLAAALAALTVLLVRKGKGNK